MSTTSDKHKDASWQSNFWRLVSGCRDMFVAAVNPRFGRFSYACTLALLVVFATVAALVAIAMSITFKCDEQCSSIPVGVVSKKMNDSSYLEDKGLVIKKPFKCVGFTTTDWIFAEELQDAIGRFVVDKGGYTRFLRGFRWETSQSSVSRCSYLHQTDDARRQWQALATAVLVANDNVTGTNVTWHPVPRPSVSGINDTKTMFLNTTLLNEVWLAFERDNIADRCSISENFNGPVVEQGWPILKVCCGVPHASTGVNNGRQ